MPRDDRTPKDPIVGASLDLSKTRTGVVRWRDREPHSATSTTFKNVGDTGALMVAFRHLMAQTLPILGIEWVAFEDVRPINKHHAEQHFGMVGILAEFCHRQNVPLIRVTSSQMKKALAGHGKADKDACLAAARERYPHANVTNHDEADALGVGLVAISLIDWEGEGRPEVEPQVPF